MMVVSAIVYVFIKDMTQKQHTILRNFPIIGHLRYYFEELGEYFRQYFIMGDRDEMPFNRATRSWVYRLAKNEGVSSALVPLTTCTSPVRCCLSTPAFRCSKMNASRPLRWSSAMAMPTSLSRRPRCSMCRA